MKSLIAASLALSFVGSAFAAAPAASTAVEASTAPRPANIVQPSGLPLDFSSTLVEIEFSLDESGQPRDIRIQSAADRAVKRQVLKAFSQWRFERANTSSAATKSDEQRFVLPLVVKAEV